MRTNNPVVDRSLNRPALAWRWLRLLQHTGTLGSIVAVLFLLLAWGAVRGWVTSPETAGILVLAVIVVALLTWACLGLMVMVRQFDSRWLARMLERGQPKLLDRVNTIEALDATRTRPEVAPFYRAILRQAQDLLAKEPASIPVSPRRPLLHLGIFLALLILTVHVYQKYSPWQRIAAAAEAKQSAQTAPAPEPRFEIPPPKQTVEQKQPWGEVRISEPGRDLEVTKVDVVPLRIEAAANEPLARVGWFTGINGAEKVPHELPPPADPRYALHQPTLYLDELKLADWDVLTYYASATTRLTNTYASEVYFLEVRPFREDILKMPGGENGRAMQCLNELSYLIGQQRGIVRETHRFAQSPPALPKLREQDRKKLAEGETDLARSTQHLYARMATELENRPIGEALDSLAKAEKSLNQAGDTLRAGALDQAQNHERSALADLIAARKIFQKSVSEHPKDFEEPTEESPPVAEPMDKLKQITEFRNEAQATQEFMAKLQRDQNALQERATRDPAPARRKLAGEEQAIQESLILFRAQHPQPFKPVQWEANTLEQKLLSAAQSLEKGGPQATTDVQAATQQMQQLADAMRERTAERQIADAYKLKQILEQQSQKFGQCENPGPGGGPSDAATQQAITDTRRALRQLKDIAEQPPSSEAFGPRLREALSDGSMLTMNWPLGELEQATAPAAKQKAAGQVKELLQGVCQAFEASQPQALQAARQAGQSGPGQAGAFERGLAQLESLMRQVQEQRPVSPQDQARLGREALHNLQEALRDPKGANDRARQLLKELQEELDPGDQAPPPDFAALKRLMDALQAFSIETFTTPEAKAERPELSAVEAGRLPPAYRSRIEKYFQKLSERSTGGDATEGVKR